MSIVAEDWTADLIDIMMGKLDYDLDGTFKKTQDFTLSSSTNRNGIDAGDFFLVDSDLGILILTQFIILIRSRSSPNWKKPKKNVFQIVTFVCFQSDCAKFE